MVFRKFRVIKVNPVTTNLLEFHHSMLKHLSLVLLIITATACKKPVEYPVEPIIKFESMEVEQGADGYDEKVFVTISFTDGDGDIGYYPRESGQNPWIFDDPTSQYYNNYIVKTSIRRSGTWVEDTTNVSARLPYMTPEGAIKALKGEIRRELTLPPLLNRDTLQYDIFIWDRALHKSNIVVTPPVVLTTR